MKLLRWLVGRIVILVNFLTQPKSPKLTTQRQQEIAELTKNLSLYHLPTCPFCVKVRRAMKREGIELPLMNIKDNNYAVREELINGGGKPTVPCLKITDAGEKKVEWLYESDDIIAYLQKTIQQGAQQPAKAA
ncbi:glutaredoxin family protein [Thalassotalea euphylliae]|uniref:Glutaredoxin n=1 Tax=Thalassotalea euphylliae TaxID=1655234 RepID=A0A3E0U0T5_9GAMM|nr:glutaredoxin [Thalassotalea euphylliae]REL30344.1 glutaredoxin [Thalassotalea euphylliae]